VNFNEYYNVIRIDDFSWSEVMKPMGRMNVSLDSKRILIAALMSVFAVSAQANPQSETDLHRPDCSDARCRKIKSFLKSHYCGESPSGNGPDDGCEIKYPNESRPGIDVLANFHCDWSDIKRDRVCMQRGQPSPSVRSILSQELRRLGLPTKASGQTHFWVWKSTRTGWSIAAAGYSRLAGADLELCEVIVIIDQSSHSTVLREVRFQKTDADAPKATEWYLVDLADADGDGQVDVILEGDAYEDHWLEVVSLHHRSPETVFSGLGYYL
jgi:hypothetical protein